MILIFAMPCTLHTTLLNNGSLNFHNREKLPSADTIHFPSAIATLVNTHTEKLDLAGHSTLPPGICNFATAMFLFLFLFIFFIWAQNKQFTSNAPSILRIWALPLTSSNLWRQRNWKNLESLKWFFFFF